MHQRHEPQDFDAPRYGLPDPWPMIGGDAALQAIEVGTAVVAGRWKPAILTLLAERTHRYNVLHRRLPGITAKMLTQQLRELEAAGLVEHEASEHGAKVSTYGLTPMGEALRPVIDAMAVWCRAYAEFRRYRAERAPVEPPRATPRADGRGRAMPPETGGAGDSAVVREHGRYGPSQEWRADAPSTRGQAG